jgi:hypothetical protein
MNPYEDANYNLIIKKDQCPTYSYSYYFDESQFDEDYDLVYDADDIGTGGTGVQESLTTCQSSGRSYALVRKDWGTGDYDISLSKTLVECCSDGDCGFTAGGVRRKCDCADAGCGQDDIATPDYTCVDPSECLDNDGCDDDHCCTKESPQGPVTSPGTCQPISNIQNPWLCT